MPGDKAATVQDLPDGDEGWPFIPGKGWFAKTRRGNEIRFLERLFLMLSFGHLPLRKFPARRLSDTIRCMPRRAPGQARLASHPSREGLIALPRGLTRRWLSPEAALRAGVPRGIFAFEIVTVELFESEVYPQYASGSFNKTAGKWCLVSPAAAGSAEDGLQPSRKLCRQCMYLPEAWTVDGVTYVVDRDRVFKPLPPGTDAETVLHYAEHCIRSLQEQQIRLVYRLRDEADRRRRQGAARVRSASAPGGGGSSAGPTRASSALAAAASASADVQDSVLLEDTGRDEEDEEVTLLTAVRRPAQPLPATTPLPAAGHRTPSPLGLVPGLGMVPSAGHDAPQRCARTITPPSTLATGVAYSFHTPDNASPRADSALHQQAARAHAAVGRPPTHRTRVHGMEALSNPEAAAGAGAAAGEPGPPSRPLTMSGALPAVRARLPDGPASGRGSRWRPGEAQEVVHGRARSGDCSSGVHTPSPEIDAGPPKITAARLAACELEDGALQWPRVLRPPAATATTTPTSTPATSVVGMSSVARPTGPAARCRGSLDEAVTLTEGAGGRHAGAADASEEAGWLASVGVRQTSDVYPYSLGKGWFAFNSQGKSIFFLERLYRMLASPNAQLKRYPSATLGQVVRWMRSSAVSQRGPAHRRPTAHAHALPAPCPPLVAAAEARRSRRAYPPVCMPLKSST